VTDELDTFVRPALAAPLTVSLDDAAVSIPVQAFAPALRVVAVDGELSTEVNGDKLRRIILGQAPTLGRAARDASIAIVDGAPKITPSLTGAHLDATQVSHAVRDVLTEPPGDGRAVALQVKTEEPQVTTEQIKALGITERMSQFSTPAYGPWGRTENIRVAARKVDGYVLTPGKTFSLNDVLGERTKENGYHTAPVIENGRLVQGYGGGVSQVATTLFNGMFFAGLEDVEHHPHSIYFSRYPEGREATLAWGAKDLRFRNDTDHGVLIQIYLSQGRLRTVFWGAKKYEVESVTGKRHNFREPDEFTSDDPRCVDQSPKSGFDVDVTRILRAGGEVARRETFSTRYRPEDKVTCVKPGERTTDASAES
jgi:vancomycin resistance protein YoaR